MVNVPVIHEAITGCMSLGHLATGDVEMAAAVWRDYRDESVLGSSIASAISACQGDVAEARRLAKGSGRATGQALLGGGLLSDVPLFKELSKCGRSLGDVIGGGDVESARRRWTEEWLREVDDPNALPKAIVNASTAAAGLVATAASAGLTTPAFLATTAVLGASCTAAGGAMSQGMDAQAGKRRSVDAGDLIGFALVGAVGCATVATVALQPPARLKAPTSPAREDAKEECRRRLAEACEAADDAGAPGAGTWGAEEARGLSEQDDDEAIDARLAVAV